MEPHHDELSGHPLLLVVAVVGLVVHIVGVALTGGDFSVVGILDALSRRPGHLTAAGGGRGAVSSVGTGPRLVAAVGVTAAAVSLNLAGARGGASGRSRPGPISLGQRLTSGERD